MSDVVLDGRYSAKYIGNPVVGFDIGRVYDIKIEKTEYSYAINVEGRTVNYSSVTSIKHNWSLGERIYND